MARTDAEISAAVEGQRRYIEAQMAQVESLLANLAAYVAVSLAKAPSAREASHSTPAPAQIMARRYPVW